MYLCVHCGSKNQTQVVRLRFGCKHLCLLSHKRTTACSRRSEGNFRSGFHLMPCLRQGPCHLLLHVLGWLALQASGNSVSTFFVATEAPGSQTYTPKPAFHEFWDSKKVSHTSYQVFPYRTSPPMSCPKFCYRNRAIDHLFPK